MAIFKRKPNSNLHTPDGKLWTPDGEKRVVRRPDFRHMVSPRPSAAPLTANEVDFDDLVIHRSWRSFDEYNPGKVRHLNYELSQRDVGQAEHDSFFKSVRLLRVTRVPRYLRQASSGTPMIFDQQRDILAALREAGVLFLNVIANCGGDTPMLFMYGSQGTGSSIEESQQLADEGHAILSAQLDGVFQQLEYEQVDVAHAESMVRFQTEWDHIAMGTGRPIPTGGSLGAAGILDGNRTDVESSLNQLEGFLRGMSDRQFIMSLVTAPLSPADMTLAWRNCSQMLSDVRSEQQGSRSFTAGVALPLSMGHSASDSTGNTHSTGSSAGVSETNGVSSTFTDGVSASDSSGVSASNSAGTSDSVTSTSTAGTSTSQSVGSTVGQSTSEGTTVGESFTYGETTGASQSVAAGETVGSTETQSTSSGQSMSETFNQSVGSSTSVSEGFSSSTSQNVSDSSNAGTNWNSASGSNTSGTVGQSSGFSENGSTTDGQSWGSSTGQSNGISSSDSQTHTEGGSSGASGGVPGVGSLTGGEAWSDAEAHGDGTSDSYNFSNNLGGSSSVTEGVSASEGISSSTTEGSSLTDSIGGTIGQGHTVGSGATQGVSNSASQSSSAQTGQAIAAGQTVTQGASIAASQSQTASATTGTSSSSTVSHGTNASQTSTATQSASTTQTAGTGTSQSQSQGATAGANRSASEGASRSASTGTNQSVAQGRSTSTGANQALTDSYAVAMSRAQASVSTLGAVPSVGVSISRATFDEEMRSIGDILESQQKRFIEAIESGAMLYQLSIVCPDRDTLLSAAGLAKASFWGPGNEKQRLVSPFETEVNFEDPERRRLVDHARVFTLDRRRQPVSEAVEPFKWSSFVTTHEAAAFCHPPTAESLGILAVHDSMPVFAMPADRTDRDITLGKLVNGERAKTSTVKYGVDTDDLKGHILVAGTTGSGKTNTTMRILHDLARMEREVTAEPTIDNPTPAPKTVKAGILAIDWMNNMRDLAGVVPEDRFKLFSVTKPELGKLAFNPLAVPVTDGSMAVADWLGDLADNMSVSFGLGEFGRSLIHEKLFMLFNANRLEPFELAKPKKNPVDDTILRDAIWLDAIDRDTLDVDAIKVTNGFEEANCFTHPELTRLVGMEHLAAIILGFVDELASPEGARQYGTSMRDRVQSLWRRLSYFATGSPFQASGIISHDERLDERTCTQVTDIVNPDEGLVTVIEADGLDQANRRFIVGSILLGVWRYGMAKGQGFFDQDGEGPGLFVALEEAHEIFGDPTAQEDNHTQATRTQLYETMFRRARALGMHLMTLVQNCASVPEAVTSNSATVILHRQFADNDRKVAFSLMNWQTSSLHRQAEWQWLGQQPTGHALIRLTPHNNYLESAPVHVKVDLVDLRKVSDDMLKEIYDRKR